MRMTCSLDLIAENQSGMIFCHIVKMRQVEEILVAYNWGQLCIMGLNLMNEEVVLRMVHWQWVGKEVKKVMVGSCLVQYCHLG